MIRVIFVLLFYISLSFSDVLNLNFRDFVMFVSSKFHKTFLYDEDFNKNIYLSVPSDLDFISYLRMIKSILVKNGFYLEYNKDFYYIKKIKKKFSIITINSNIDSNVTSNFNVSLYHIEKNKYAVFYKYTSDFLKFKRFVSNFHFPATLKLTGSIYRINNDFIKNHNINLSLLINSINKFDTGIISNIDFYKSIGFNINSSSISLNSYLDFLNSKGILNVVVRPNFIINSGKKVSFHTSKIYRIPNQIVTSYDKTIPTNTTTYEEKEAGLKIDILPIVYTKKVLLKINFEDSNYQNNNDNFVKNLISFNSTFYIPLNKSVAIAGLTSNTTFNNNQSKIPILSNLPLFSFLFNSHSKSNNYNSYVLYFKVDVLDTSIKLSKKGFKSFYSLKK